MSERRIDWREIGRGGSRAIATPTLLVIGATAAMVALLLLVTIGMAGAGAWVLRGVAIVLAVPIVMLAVRRQQVLHRFSELERTGEHPDNVVRSTAPDGQEVEIIVAGAERTIVPRLGLGSLTGYAFGALASGGVAFGIFVIVGVARLVSGN